MNQIYYKKGYKYQLNKEYTIFIKFLKDIKSIETDYILLNDGFLTIKKGYAWDGASGIFTVDTKSSMRPSLVHDSLIQLIELKVLDISQRSFIDDVFFNLLKEDGMLAIRAKYWYLGVGIYTNFGITPKLKPVITAP